MRLLKVLSGSSSQEFEDRLNEWILDNQDCEVVSISHAVSLGDLSAVILYHKIEKTERFIDFK